MTGPNNCPRKPIAAASCVNLYIIYEDDGKLAQFLDEIRTLQGWRMHRQTAMMVPDSTIIVNKYSVDAVFAHMYNLHE
jgi:hypothetical protein